MHLLVAEADLLVAVVAVQVVELGSQTKVFCCCCFFGHVSHSEVVCKCLPSPQLRPLSLCVFVSTLYPRLSLSPSVLLCPCPYVSPSLCDPVPVSLRLNNYVPVSVSMWPCSYLSPSQCVPLSIIISLSPSLCVPVSVCLVCLYVSRSLYAPVLVSSHIYVSLSLYVPVSICPRLYNYVPVLICPRPYVSPSLWVPFSAYLRPCVFPVSTCPCLYNYVLVSMFLLCFHVSLSL